MYNQTYKIGGVVIERLGLILIILGFIIMCGMGWWALNSYLTYNNCVREAYRAYTRDIVESDIRPKEIDNALERAVMGCSTNNGEFAGAGIILGSIVLVLGIVKSFLDKKSAEIYVEEGDKIMGDKKTEVLIGDNATIQGDFIVANSIRDSFNKAASADISDELKSSLKELSIAVGKMSERLDKEEAEQVARDLETLTSEATSQKPRKKWWELSVEGLKDAAQNVGEIGKPVIELATHIAVILSGLSTS